MSVDVQTSSIHLRLPATSANLGPGFDALGLAISLYLTIDATASPDGAYAIEATGRDREICGDIEHSLILATYRDVILKAGKDAPSIHLLLHNEIPLGMGCGSSAAALLAGVLLANHFGGLGWTGYQAMEEACRREGHPDNVAACWLGGMTASAMGAGNTVLTASCGADCKWGLLLVVPSVGLSTMKARALLPESYSKADAVFNVQHTALLVAAFALGRADLLETAMSDRLHQPYREAACPLLPLMLPLSGQPGILGVALSGAGPSVLVIYEPEMLAEVSAFVRRVTGEVELIETSTSKGTITLVT